MMKIPLLSGSAPARPSARLPLTDAVEAYRLAIRGHTAEQVASTLGLRKRDVEQTFFLLKSDLQRREKLPR